MALSINRSKPWTLIVANRPTVDHLRAARRLSVLSADLVSMHVLRVITSTQEAMAFMGGLQRNLRSPVVLFAMVVISAGIVEVLRERQKREARVRRLVDFNIIGVFIWGPDGQIIDANEAFLRIVGYSRDDLASGPCWRELTPTQ
jgi:PAS domain-containing protein